MASASDYEKAAREALSAWEMDHSSLTLVSLSENVVFRVGSADQLFALRFHRPGYHTLAELKSELAWTKALTAAGINVPVALHTPGGRGYVTVSVGPDEVDHQVGLVEWLPGVLLRDQLQSTADPRTWSDAFYRLGALAGQMHNQASGWQPPAGFRRHALDADGLMGEEPFWGRFWTQPALSLDERRMVETARERICRILTDYGYDGAMFSMIHADLHPGNLLTSKSNLRVIDFDDAGFGWHAYDLAVGLFNYQDEPCFDEIRQALFAGYRSIRTLDRSIVDLLPLFLLVRALALLGWIQGRPELGQEHRLPGLIRRASTQIKALGLDGA